MNRFLILFLLTYTAWSQDSLITPKVVDSLYREDQFYVGVTYNTLQNRPAGLSQNSFSSGISLGFLRDFPINKTRNIALAPGFGLSVQSYNQNMLAAVSEGQILYTLSSQSDFKRNLFSFYTAEIPIEFRWRSSTAASHKFWRFYTGFKLSYVFYDNTRTLFSDSKNVIVNSPDYQKWQTGVYTTFGFNTWNFYMYYGLQPIFKPTAILDGKVIDMRVIQFGLQFYIL